MKKRIIFLLVLSVIFCSTLFSQQITRFAVIDLTKVYMAFFRDSNALREIDRRSKEVQSEINRLTKELQEIKTKHADAVVKGNKLEALRLEHEIYNKSEFIKEYYEKMTKELDNERNKLAQSGSFKDQLNREIRYVAESKGYTMVLNLRDNPSIVWYSPSVDITDEVIQNLLDKTRR